MTCKFGYGFLACVLLVPGFAQAETIRAAWDFNANDDSDLSSISQTVSALDGLVTFDFNVSMTSAQGTVVDTSEDTANTGEGIGVGAGTRMESGESVTFAVSISNVQSSLQGDADFSNLTFRFLGTDAANGSASKGTLTISAMDYSWQDANGGPTEMTFPGHIKGVTTYQGFKTDKDGQTQAAFSVKSGFDLPATSGGSVETFSHLTTAGSYRLNDLVVEVEVAEVVRAGWNFDENDDSDLSSISQSVSALGGAVTFDFSVTMMSDQGTVVDTSSITGPSNQRRGIGVNAFSNMDFGESILFGLSIANVSGVADFSNLTFRFVGVEAGNGNTSAGRLTISAVDYIWQDANGNGVTNNAANTGADFGGHLPGVTHYSAGQNGFITVQSGFDLPETSGGSVASFSHLTTAGSYRLNDLVVEVEVSTSD